MRSAQLLLSASFQEKLEDSLFPPYHLSSDFSYGIFTFFLALPSPPPRPPPTGRRALGLHTWPCHRPRPPLLPPLSGPGGPARPLPAPASRAPARGGGRVSPLCRPPRPRRPRSEAPLLPRQAMSTRPFAHPPHRAGRPAPCLPVDLLCALPGMGAWRGPRGLFPATLPAPQESGPVSWAVL